MTWLVNCLVRKHQNQSWDPQQPHKCWSGVTGPGYIPSMRGDSEFPEKARQLNSVNQ